MIRALHHVGITVPDLTVAEHFMEAFGLETTEVGGELEARSPGRGQPEVRFNEGPTKRLRHVAFHTGHGSTDRVRSALQAAGIDEIHDRDDGLSITDPDGNTVLLVASDPAPTREVDTPATNATGAVARVNDAFWRHALDDPQPFRLGHSLIFSPDPDAMERFYVDLLGLGLSDRIIGKVTFLNAGPGDHHVFGFIRSSHPGLHHMSFEVNGLDGIAGSAQRLAEYGYQEGWGIGRHSIGSNLFHYAADPWGSWFEVFSDIDAIDESWEPSDWDTPPAIWGGAPPPDFIVNKEQPHG